MPVSKLSLNNGIILITEPVATAKTAAVGFWFYTGSRYETDTKRGISHFVEHLLFKGTTTKSAFDIAVSFDRIGGYINAFTDRENICVHCVVPSLYTIQALSVMNDMMLNSTLTRMDIEKERSVIENEIVSGLDDPEEAANDAIFESIWPGQTISQSISGSAEDIQKISREELYEWYSKNIVQGKLVVCISGNFNEEDVVELLGKNPCRQNHAEESSFSLPQWKTGMHCLKAGFQQQQIFLLYPIKKPETIDSFLQWSLLNAIIGDTMSSRLFQSLREKAGYCYNVFSYVSLFCDSAFWCAYASSSKKNTYRVIADLFDQMKLFFTGRISADELESARQHICGEEIIASEDPEQRMKMLARLHFLNLPLLSSEERIERIMKISIEQIQSLIFELSIEKQKALALYGPSVPLRHKNVIKKLFNTL